MAGRPPRTEEVKVVFLRLPTDLLKRVTRCTGMIETREGVRLDQTKAFRHLLEIACDAVEHQQTPLAPLAVSETSKLVEIANIADGTPPAYDDMLACLGDEDEEETPVLPVDVPQAAETPEPRKTPMIPIGMQQCPLGHAPYPMSQSECPTCGRERQRSQHTVSQQPEGEVMPVPGYKVRPRHGGVAEDVPAPEAPAEPIAELSYNGNTVLQENAEQTDIPPFDSTKYVLGKLCPQRHEWGTTGQSRLTIHDRVCPECRNALKRRKRAEKRQGQPV